VHHNLFPKMTGTIENAEHLLTRTNGMARRSPPRKVTYFEPVPPRLARNTIIESTFEVGRRFRCTVRVDCGQLEPDAVIRRSIQPAR
jgi:hypothetical protein